jgi:hypothetical protein
MDHHAPLILPLASPAALFAAPDLDPWQGQLETMSGVDRLLLALDPLPPGEIPDLILEFPAADLDDDLADRASAALTAYAGSRIATLEREKERIRRRGMKELVYGLLFLGGCLVGSALLGGTDWGPAWFTEFLSEGLIIIGWIALWHPGDMLLFERWPLIREQRLLSRLQEATVSVQAGPGVA